MAQNFVQKNNEFKNIHNPNNYVHSSNKAQKEF
jgi:hypothetical protein